MKSPAFNFSSQTPHFEPPHIQRVIYIAWRGPGFFYSNPPNPSTTFQTEKGGFFKVPTPKLNTRGHDHYPSVLYHYNINIRVLCASRFIDTKTLSWTAIVGW
jgi:hypothetical protein